MVLYNVTVNVDATIEKEWIEWMKNEHILDVLNTKCFHDAKFWRVIGQTNTDEGITYAIMYFCESKALLQKYLAQFSETLQSKSKQKFGEKALAFRTMLEEV